MKSETAGSGRGLLGVCVLPTFILFSVFVLLCEARLDCGEHTSVPRRGSDHSALTGSLVMWNSLKRCLWTLVCCVVLGKLLSEVRFFSKTSLMEAENDPSEVLCYPRSKDELLTSHAEEVSGENFFFSCR